MGILFAIIVLKQQVIWKLNGEMNENPLRSGKFHSMIIEDEYIWNRREAVPGKSVTRKYMIKVMCNYGEF